MTTEERCAKLEEAENLVRAVKEDVLEAGDTEDTLWWTLQVLGTGLYAARRVTRDSAEATKRALVNGLGSNFTKS